MNFGVPSQRRKGKQERFPNKPVLTLGISGGAGTSRKMFLNKSAVETLGLPEEGAVVAFSFELNEEKTECLSVSIANGNNDNVPDYARIRVTKSNPRSISQKKTYEYISGKAFQLDNSVENHFHLTTSSVIQEEEGAPVLFTLTLISENTNATDNAEEPADQVAFAGVELDSAEPTQQEAEQAQPVI